jgi:hypothetical protein
MPRGKGTRNASKSESSRVCLILWPLVLCLPCLTGCAGESNLTSDPLVGGPPLRTAAQPASRSTPLPPLAAPSSATSPAALARGAFQPLDPEHHLQIASGGSKPGNVTWRGQGGVVLNQPQSVPQTTPILIPPAPAAPTGEPRSASPLVLTGGTRADSLEEALAQIDSRGATWSRLETWGDNGEWKFSCSIPVKQTPGIRRTYEARARDRLSAIRAVLQQIEQEQR